MTKFKDGPADGVSLILQRAPLFLRVVCADGKFDALDMLNDEPRRDENIWVYRKVSDDGSGHLCGTKKGRRFGAWFISATYEFCELQPDESILRETSAWREWSIEQGKRIRENGLSG